MQKVGAVRVGRFKLAGVKKPRIWPPGFRVSASVAPKSGQSADHGANTASRIGCGRTLSAGGMAVNIKARIHSKDGTQRCYPEAKRRFVRRGAGGRGEHLDAGKIQLRPPVDFLGRDLSCFAKNIQRGCHTLQRRIVHLEMTELNH